jgi:Tol biopolymer transport system component
MSRRDGNAEIYVMNADGSDQVNVSNHPQSDFLPSWQPQVSGGALAQAQEGMQGDGCWFRQVLGL